MLQTVAGGVINKGERARRGRGSRLRSSSQSAFKLEINRVTEFLDNLEFKLKLEDATCDRSFVYFIKSTLTIHLNL